MSFTIRPVKANEVTDVLDAIQRVVSTSNHALRIIQTTVEYDPAFRPEQLWIGEAGGLLVAMVLSTERVLRIGHAPVRGGLLVPVVSPAGDQGQATCSAIIQESLKRLAAAGKQLALLWGHDWLYPRYGFAPATKRYSVLLPADMEPPGPGACTLRPATAADLPALQGCYASMTHETSLAPARAGEWEWQPSDPRQTVEVVVDAAASVRGYARWRGDEAMLQVAEIAALDENSALALTGHLLAMAHPQPVMVTASPDNLWTRVVWRRGAEVRSSAGANEPLVRVLDLRSLMTALVPELERRIGRSEYVGQRTALSLETPVGTLGLRIEHGRVLLAERLRPAVTLPFAVLSALVTGYRSMRDMVGEPGVQIETQASMRLLEVLFPEGYPCWLAAPSY